jgi:hypothetical protein
MNIEVVMIRLSKAKLAQLRSVAGRHPLKPTLRAAVERGIELVIADLEKDNAK